MNIWVPKIKIIENTREAIEFPGSRLEGFYDITIRHPNGLDEHRLFPNLITDYGLNQWAAQNPIQYCSIGSGATPPSTSVSTISGFLQSTSNTVSGVQAGKVTENPFNGFVTVTWDFGTNSSGSAKTFTNVGVGVANNGTNLWSHAQVLDAGGSPDSQTWPNGSTLQIAYRCNIYPWLSDSAYSGVSIGANTYSGILRPGDITNPLNGQFCLGAQKMGSNGDLPEAAAWTGTIGSMSQVPGGFGTTSTSGGTAAYTHDSFERSGWASWDATQANGNINTFTVAPTTFWYQLSVVPTLVKQVDWYLTLNFQSGAWGRL